MAYHGDQAEHFITVMRAAGAPLPAATRDGISGRALLDRQVVHVSDLEAVVATEFPASQLAASVGGSRAQLAVPLLRGDDAIGVLSVLRFQPGPFADAEIALLQAFADQAVIAIENARLFQELEQRTAQLTDALERQTATADILRVIASSQAELEPVFEAVAERARRLCHASAARIYLVDGDTHRIVMSVAESDEAIGLVAGFPRRGIGVVGPLSRQSMTGRTIIDRRVLRVDDAHSAEVIAEFPISPTGPVTRAHASTCRSCVTARRLASSQSREWSTRRSRTVKSHCWRRSRIRRSLRLRTRACSRNWSSAPETH